MAAEPALRAQAGPLTSGSAPPPAMSPQPLPVAAEQPAGAPLGGAAAGDGGPTGSPESSGSASGDVLALVDAFLAAQRERAAAYRRLDAAFRAYLQTQAEGPYRWVGGRRAGAAGLGAAHTHLVAAGAGGSDSLSAAPLLPHAMGGAGTP